MIYAAVQQNYRQSANDPQIQMAEDAAARLSAGESPQALIPGQAVDLAKSLAPYTIVFDADGQALASGAELDGSSPSPPNGVLDYAETNGQNAITWQPRDGVRSAI